MVHEAIDRGRDPVCSAAMRLRELLRPRYDGAVAATIGGIVDRLRDRGAPLALAPGDRLEGRTCLVTGANRGLGLAIATELTRLGGHVLLACRSGIPDVMDVVRRSAAEAAPVSGAHAGTVEAVRLDLGDLGSIERVVDELAEDGVSLDVVVLNAGIVPREARRTRDGFDESFQVNFLANVLFVRRLIERGVIARSGDGGDGEGGDPDASDAPRVRPRVVFVSSESHRSAPPIDFARLGTFRAWTMREAVAEYGYAKLLVETWAAELARRCEGAIAVHTVCPGAVHTDIGREAPSWAKPALDATMRAFFKPPEAGAVPVVWLAAARAIEGESGLYYHVHQRKQRSEAARDRARGERLWAASERLLDAAGHPLAPIGPRGSGGDERR